MVVSLGKKFQCKVLRVETPGKFYIRFLRDVEQFNQVMKRLNSKAFVRTELSEEDVSVGMSGLHMCEVVYRTKSV